MPDRYDIFIVGGGINGCGIARDAAGRGYSVCLCEMNDLASGTSSMSTKLVHGGLRYLEYFEFRLVREALIEREILWSMAPHIIWPLRFVLPHDSSQRPAWFLRLGLFLYDHIGGRKLLPPTKSLDLSRDKLGQALNGRFRRGFEYSDCWVDDARLVVLNARDARRRGADIRSRTRVVSARPNGSDWQLHLENRETDTKEVVRARLIINAAGPWVDTVLKDVFGQNDPANVRLVQGSHIVVKKLFDHDRCYIFQNADKRIVFAIPYEGDYTLIGTTDQDYAADPGAAGISPAISEAEVDYLLAAANQYFDSPICRGDIVWSYSGVRPLYDDGASEAQRATRDYIVKSGEDAGKPPVINIFGGKITTYRRLAESVMDRVEERLGKRKSAWTARAPLPGGDFDVNGQAGLCAQLSEDHPYLQDDHIARLVRHYGTDSLRILDGATTLEDLGKHFGAGLYEREVAWLMSDEWAMRAEDVAWRRSKLGLKLSGAQMADLEAWMQDRRRREAAARTNNGS
jgi:glycerol-3-phosphate dehydrogenase